MTIYPGKTTETTFYYEDDGHSTDYMKTTDAVNNPINSATTNITYVSENQFRPKNIEVYAQIKGDYEGLPKTR